MVAAANINDEILSMSPAQLREVQARISALLNPTGEAKQEKDADLSLVGEEFVAVLRSVGVPKCLPLPVLLGTRHAPKLKRGAAALLAYVRENFKPRSQIEERKIVKMFFGLAVQNLRDRHKPLPVGVLTLCQQMVDVHKVFNRYFPGYQESGLLPILVNRTMQTVR